MVHVNAYRTTRTKERRWRKVQARRPPTHAGLTRSHAGLTRSHAVRM